jgi:hypothetical protein
MLTPFALTAVGSGIVWIFGNTAVAIPPFILTFVLLLVDHVHIPPRAYILQYVAKVTYVTETAKAVMGVTPTATRFQSNKSSRNDFLRFL